MLHGYNTMAASTTVHTNPVELWSAKDVTEWLKFINLDDCIDDFESNHVNGKKLLVSK